MTFKEWLKLQEVGTGTNAIATFARPIGIGMVKRIPIPSVGNDANDEDKKKSK